MVVAGATASITLGPTRRKLVASVEPNLTAVTPAKWLPTSLTVVPPVIGPAFGSTVWMKPAAGVMGAEAMTTGGGPLHAPLKARLPRVTLRLPAGLMATVVLVAPEANDV